MSQNLIYPELSYKIVGIAFNVFNEHGYGMSEKYYQQAFAKMLTSAPLSFEREKHVVIKHGEVSVARFFLDFIVDNKVAVELKIRQRLGYIHIKQVTNYLKATGYKLAILIYFTREGVKYRRVLNAY